MRILFVSAEPIRLRQASDTHVNEIVKGLRLAGHDVTLCVTRVMGPYENTPFRLRCIAYLVFWVQVMKQLRRGMVVYTRAHPANFPIALAAWLMRVPIVHEINGSYYDVFITHTRLLPFKSVITALQRFQYRKANALIAITPQLADWVREEAPAVSIVTVPNGANCGIFRPTQPAVRAVAQDYALFYGSLTRWHGIEIMIAAAEHDSWPANLDLVIIGDGQLRPMTQQASERNSRIHVLGSVPQTVLASYINGAVVGLVPINSVGGRGKFGFSPLKLYEMLACGLPVIVTDFPEQANLVHSLEAGAVVPPDNPEALAAAVAQLHANPPPREKMTKIASIIKDEHGWSNRATEIAKVLAGVVEH